jgi:hypothetical protein
VFTWGLQYKLSLYDAPNSASRQIPEAKLLSGNEQSRAAENTFVEATKAPPAVAYPLIFSAFTALLLAFALAYAAMSGQGMQESRRPWRLSCRRSMTAFFFRPPPVLA